MSKGGRSIDEEVGSTVVGEIKEMKRERRRMQQQIDDSLVGVQVQMTQF